MLLNALIFEAERLIVEGFGHHEGAVGVAFLYLQRLHTLRVICCCLLGHVHALVIAAIDVVMDAHGRLVVLVKDRC